MVDDKHYKHGQLVQLDILNRCFTDDGLAAVGTLDVYERSHAIIFSEISLSNYPSCNDFLGDQTVVSHGDLATVLSFKGRPYNISEAPQWECYDVYEILIGGSIRDIFHHNILPVNTMSDLENQG